jgi:hypothetical protein
MTLSKLTFLIITFNILIFLKASGQDAPLSMAMPTDSNTLLVDKIIEITDHEKYFTDYCTNRVMAYAKSSRWTENKTNEILSSIKFKYYNSTIYNSYAFYSADQLAKLLDALTVLKTSQNRQNFILTNEMMQSNLDLFVKAVIEGKYVVKNK